MKIAYLRVSSTDQNEARQQEAMTGLEIDRWYTDKCSGATTDRPELEKLKHVVRSGDQVYCLSIDRMARSLKDLLALLEFFKAEGVSVRFLKEGLDLGVKDNAMDELMISVMGAVAQFERSMIKERQLEGIAAAKARGVYKGKKPTYDPEELCSWRAQHKASIAVTADKFGCSVATVKRVWSEAVKAGKHQSFRAGSATQGKD